MRVTNKLKFRGGNPRIKKGDILIPTGDIDCDSLHDIMEKNGFYNCYNPEYREKYVEMGVSDPENYWFFTSLMADPSPEICVSVNRKQEALAIIFSVLL